MGWWIVPQWFGIPSAESPIPGALWKCQSRSGVSPRTFVRPPIPCSSLSAVVEVSTPATRNHLGLSDDLPVLVAPLHLDPFNLRPRCSARWRLRGGAGQKRSRRRHPHLRESSIPVQRVSPLRNLGPLDPVIHRGWRVGVCPKCPCATLALAGDPVSLRHRPGRRVEGRRQLHWSLIFERLWGAPQHRGQG